jgi:hypothetical protein
MRTQSFQSVFVPGRCRRGPGRIGATGSAATRDVTDAARYPRRDRGLHRPARQRSRGADSVNGDPEPGRLSVSGAAEVADIFATLASILGVDRLDAETIQVRPLTAPAQSARRRSSLAEIHPQAELAAGAARASAARGGSGPCATRCWPDRRPLARRSLAVRRGVGTRPCPVLGRVEAPRPGDSAAGVRTRHFMDSTILAAGRRWHLRFHPAGRQYGAADGTSFEHSGDVR